MNTLFILNDPPYGTERAYNGLRLAHALVKKEPQTGVTVFLMADAVGCRQERARRRRTATTMSNEC